MVQSSALVPRNGAVGGELLGLLSVEGIDVRALSVTGTPGPR
ncbi:hypothetical protein ACFS2C_17215 [Prauserella oleivorans]|uniref:Uncharacterized protein n=1 Tax=Prauserella oleivorans TaxID=1478153 RepID=A0ABW5WC72_9PSEU